MSLTEWLEERASAQPPSLARRLADLVGDLEEPPAGVPEGCLATAERALGVLLRKDAGSRDTALNLLAIDGLVTYAFESAASDPERIPALAATAMQRLSRLAPST